MEWSWSVLRYHLRNFLSVPKRKREKHFMSDVPWAEIRTRNSWARTRSYCAPTFDVTRKKLTWDLNFYESDFLISGSVFTIRSAVIFHADEKRKSTVSCEEIVTFVFRNSWSVYHEMKRKLSGVCAEISHVQNCQTPYYQNALKSNNVKFSGWKGKTKANLW